MYRKTVCDNGLQIISEHLPHSQLVSLGIWIDVGSRDEHDLNNGTAHFIEHMLFKGTLRRNGQQIARELDALGGTANAFTSRDTTCYYATVLDTHLDLLVDLLADIFTNSCFAQEEVARERQVILQEISMVEDTPDDHIHDLFTALLWGRHPLANTVLGNRGVVVTMDANRLIDAFHSFYSPERIIVAAAGKVDHDRLVDTWVKAVADRLPGGVARLQERRPPGMLEPQRAVYTKPLEQTHLLLGTYGLSALDPKRYAFMLLNVLLGGNMSSRLFQELREKHGLAYSVYSYATTYTDCGSLAIYLGVERRSVNEALARTVQELERFRHTAPVTEAELANARDYVKAGLHLAAESVEAIMTRIARNELTYGRALPFSEVVEAIDRVSSEEINTLAAELLSREMTVAALGPVRSEEIDWTLLRSKEEKG